MNKLIIACLAVVGLSACAVQIEPVHHYPARVRTVVIVEPNHHHHHRRYNSYGHRHIYHYEHRKEDTLNNVRPRHNH